MKQVMCILFMFFLASAFAENRLNTINTLDENKINSSFEKVVFVDENECLVFEKTSDSFLSNRKPNPLLKIFRKKEVLSKKIKAAALAFPFPFGIVGLHRIYLGTSPYVPVAYIGTVGGVFGILPLIDFFKILLDKNIEPFQNNGKVFMWIKD